MITKKQYQYKYLIEKVFALYHKILGQIDDSCSLSEIDEKMTRHDFYLDWLLKINKKYKYNEQKEVA